MLQVGENKNAKDNTLIAYYNRITFLLFDLRNIQKVGKSTAVVV